MRRWVWNILAGLSLLVWGGVMVLSIRFHDVPGGVWWTRRDSVPQWGEATGFWYATVQGDRLIVGEWRDPAYMSEVAVRHMMTLSSLESVRSLFDAKTEEECAREWLSARGVHGGKAEYLFGQFLRPWQPSASDRVIDLGYPRLGYESVERQDGVTRMRRATVPVWGVAPLLLALPAWRVGLFCRRRVRRRRGCCLGCGYDLRGSGERCPECGRERSEMSR